MAGLVLGLLASVFVGCAGTPAGVPDEGRSSAAPDFKKGKSTAGRVGDVLISFYGKVVDQDGTPLESATVRYSVVNMMLGAPSWRSTLTDSRGCFEMKGLTGVALEVRVSKDGYRDIRVPRGSPGGSSGMFEYVNIGSRDPHRPEKGKPVVFVVRKIGKLYPLLKREGFLNVSPRGIPAYWSLDPEDNRSKHGLVVSCNSDCTASLAETIGARYDWSFEIKVVDGGLAEKLDRDGLEAPADGYVPSEKIVMKADAPRWDRSFTKSFYIRFNDGVCARVEVNGFASVEPRGTPYMYFESAVNPDSSSRSLEEPPLKLRK